MVRGACDWGYGQAPLPGTKCEANLPCALRGIGCDADAEHEVEEGAIQKAFAA